MMNTLLTTMCAASLGAAPPPDGVSPESFVTSFRQVIIAEAAATTEGEIRSIAEDKESFVIRDAEGEYMSIRLNDETKITLDGKESDRDSALQVGRRAKVTHEDGVASRVDVFTKDLHNRG